MLVGRMRLGEKSAPAAGRINYAIERIDRRSPLPIVGRSIVFWCRCVICLVGLGALNSNVNGDDPPPTATQVESDKAGPDPGDDVSMVDDEAIRNAILDLAMANVMGAEQAIEIANRNQLWGSRKGEVLDTIRNRSGENAGSNSQILRDLSIIESFEMPGDQRRDLLFKLVLRSLEWSHKAKLESRSVAKASVPTELIKATLVSFDGHEEDLFKRLSDIKGHGRMDDDLRLSVLRLGSDAHLVLHRDYLLALATKDSLSNDYRRAVLPLLERLIIQNRIKDLPKSQIAEKDVDPKYLVYAKRVISRNDRNGDGMLSGSEMKNMLLSVAPADQDQNGIVTALEYAHYIQQRDQ